MSNYHDGDRIWVKMSRAASEKQLAAGPESRDDTSDDATASEAYVTCSRRVTGAERVEARGYVDMIMVDVEPLQVHRSLGVVVPGGMMGDVMTVGTVVYRSGWRSRWRSTW